MGAATVIEAPLIAELVALQPFTSVYSSVGVFMMVPVAFTCAVTVKAFAEDHDHVPEKIPAYVPDELSEKSTFGVVEEPDDGMLL
jgi:hypothetical protein